MTTEQDKICDVLNKVLTNDGWKQIRDNKNLYEKNDCILALYINSTIYEDHNDVEGHLACIPILRSAPMNSWQLERSGVVLGAGRIPTSIRLLENGDNSNNEFAKIDLNKFLARIESLMNLDEYQQYGSKMSEIISYKQKKSMVAKETNKRVLEDSSAIVFKAVADALPWFTVGNVYMLSDKFASGVLTIYKLNKALTGSIGNPIHMDDIQTFGQLCRDRVLVNVEIVEDVVNIPKYSFGSTSNNTTKLPEQILNLGLPVDYLIHVNELYAENYNYTYLLQGCRNREVVSKLKEMCKVIGYIGDIDWSGFNSENADAIINAVKAGYDLKDLLGKSSDEITKYLKQQTEYVTELMEMLKDNNISFSVSAAIPRVMNKVDIWQIKNVNSAFELLLSTDIQLGYNTIIARFLLREGVSSGTIFKARIPSNNDSLKKAILGYFGCKYSFRIVNNDWTTVMLRAVTNATCICYTLEHGYLLQVNNQYVGRDNNSLVVYDSQLLPIWRGVYINEEIISNSDAATLVSL